MNIAELFKKNFILVPVIASVLVGTFTAVRYVLNLTDTISANQETIINLEEKVLTARADINDLKQRLSAAEATWSMAENLYRQLADTVRDHTYDLKDLTR